MLGYGVDECKYDIVVEIFCDFGFVDEGICFFINNLEKVRGFVREGVKVVERVGMMFRSW